MIRFVWVVLFVAIPTWGESLEFLKTLGNGQPASAAAVITDATRNIYVAGFTSGDGLATPHAVQSTRAGAGDAFVAKYTPSGTLVWFTYLGGTDVDYATGVALDKAGNVYVCGITMSRDFPAVSALQPAIHPSANGAGFVAKISADGAKLLYSTYLGGSAFDLVNAIAVDGKGSAYVTGSAESTDFPVVNPIQPAASNTVVSAFVTKFAPNGASLLYSTRLGGGSGHAIAVDASGQAYVTGETMSADFPVVNAAQSKLQGFDDVFVAKLDSAGAHLVYSTFLGGSGPQTGRAIAIDAEGSAYVTGDTTSVDFPVLSAFHPRLNAVQVAKSTDGGNTWAAITNGFTTTYPITLAIDPNHPSTLYVPTYDFGILKSTDGGSSWHIDNHGLPVNPAVHAEGVDPSNSLNVYAAVSDYGVYKSVDGGAAWTASSSGLPRFPSFNFFTFVPGMSSTVLVGGGMEGVYRSTDAGATWSMLPVDSHANSYFIDPQNPMNQYAGISGYFSSPNIFSLGGIVKSTDGGKSFVSVAQPPLGLVNQLGGIDPRVPAILYGYNGGLVKSTDGAATWLPIGPDNGSYSSFGNLVIDPGNSSTIYASGEEGIFRSMNRGATWTRINPIVTPPRGARIAAVDPSNSAILYALGGEVHSDAFVAKFDTTGALVYSTYLGGSGDEIAHGIAIDPHGMAVITGATSSSDLPLAHAIQGTYGGGGGYDTGDVFVSVLSPDGRVLDFSTYLGGSNAEAAYAMTVDWEGAIVVAGQTTTLTATTALSQGLLAKIRRYRRPPHVRR